MWATLYIYIHYLSNMKTKKLIDIYKIKKYHYDRFYNNLMIYLFIIVYDRHIFNSNIFHTSTAFIT